MKKKTNQSRLALAVTFTLALAFLLSSVQFAYADIAPEPETERKWEAQAAATEAFFNEHKDEMRSVKFLYDMDTTKHQIIILCTPHKDDPVVALLENAETPYSFTISYTIVENGEEWGYIDFDTVTNRNIPHEPPFIDYNRSSNGGWTRLSDLEQAGGVFVASESSVISEPTVTREPSLANDDGNAANGEGTLFTNNDGLILAIVLTAGIVVIAVILIVVISGRRRGKS